MCKEKAISFKKETKNQTRMLFYSFFKTLHGKQVVVELKNDLAIQGTLDSVDQYLNIKLNDISVLDAVAHPYLSSVKNCFVRGSTVRYIHIPKDLVDVELLQDATRLEAREAKKVAADR
jgi:U6 snRNA-associated Sm-like protein LSm2